ncbi:MAG: hypothetical protein AAGB28_18390, partial [Pseudomonadota bacterium]
MKSGFLMDASGLFECSKQLQSLTFLLHDPTTGQRGWERSAPQVSTEIFQIVAPVFLVVGIGFFLEWRGMGFHAESLSRLAMLLGTPALVFSSLISTALPNDSLARIVAIAVSAVLIGGGIAFL